MSHDTQRSEARLDEIPRQPQETLVTRKGALGHTPVHIELASADRLKESP